MRAFSVWPEGMPGEEHKSEAVVQQTHGYSEK
jgi:hypothetical protein